MSSSLRDTVEKLNYIWKHINEFLYENGKPTLRHGKPGVLIEHTEQEYIDFLNELAQDSLESYRDFAIEYGWIDAPTCDIEDVYNKAIDDFAALLKKMANESSTYYIRLADYNTNSDLRFYNIDELAEQLKRR